MKTQNLQPKTSMSFTVNKKVITHEKVQLNFKQIHQNQIFVIIQMRNI